MGANWSQLLRPIPYTCYELGHTWNPSCSASALEVGLCCLEESLKIYSSVYAVSMLLRSFAKAPNQMALMTLLKNIVRSSAFLSYNAFFFVWAFCTIRKLIGRHNYYTFGFISAWIASFLAIFVEGEHRRPLLATYATESLLKCLPKTWPKISHGEKLLFAITSSVLLYLFKLKESKEDKKDFVFGFLRLIFGSEEENTADFAGPNVANNNWRHVIPTSLTNILKGRKSQACQHSDSSCLFYALKGFAKPFLLGTLGQIGLDWFKRRQQNASIAATCKPGFSLGILVGLFKVLTCFSRHCLGRDDARMSAATGFISGSASALIYPSQSLSIYIAWKTLEILSRRGVSKGILPNIPFSVEVLYATATSILFHLAVVSPHKLKPSYFKFMNKITGNRVSEINRFLLDHEYANISEAALVYKHVPIYSEQHLSSSMKQVWPQMLLHQTK